ncbi:MAG: hypothetical protein IKT57_03170 [Clostridia bacterium]|nr:hypothetical protein [Clostridia bacterium]
MRTLQLSWKDEHKGQVSPMIYGQFIEQLGDCVHGGIYDEHSVFSDEKHIRLDVLEKVKRLAPPVIRFPGGTVMCIYHWQDAVGPVEERKHKKNLIWGGVLRPEFGTAEFVEYCRRVGAEPMLCVNMASGTPEEAGAWVEYCNGTEDTYYANLRRQHGYEEPFCVKYWCIGNECYAEPDIGVQHDVHTYIRDAKEFIKFMKLEDKSIKTVIVGCDDTPGWNKPVLDALQDFADYFSYHFYAAENDRGLYGPFYGEKLFLDRIHELGELLDSYPEEPVNYSKWYRFPPRQDKIRLLVDEWNIWEYRDDEIYGLHMTYNWRDAVWAASMLNHFIGDIHIAGCNMAQLCNIIAPIMADDQGSYEQTIFLPCEKYRHSMYGKRLTPCLEGENTLSLGSDLEMSAVSCAVVEREGKRFVSLVNRDFAQPCCIKVPASLKGICYVSADPCAVNAREEKCFTETAVQCNEGESLVLPAGAIMLLQED